MADFGLEQKLVELLPVNGGNGIWHLMVDRFYLAQIISIAGKWECKFQHAPDWVTATEMDLLSGMLDGYQQNC